MFRGFILAMALLFAPAALHAQGLADNISAADMEAIPKMSIQTLKAKMDKGERIAVIDSRTGTSWSGSKLRIKGDIRIMLKDIAAGNVSDIPMGSEIIVYCT